MTAWLRLCRLFVSSGLMNDKDLERKIKEEMDKEVEERGYAAPADLLMALGYLDKGGYMEWKEGRVPFLEKVLRIGPQKVLRLLAVMSAHAKKEGYKPSRTVYTKNGSPAVVLRFSRSGNEVIEGQFSTHYVDKFWGMRD